MAISLVRLLVRMLVRLLIGVVCVEFLPDIICEVCVLVMFSHP